MSEEEAAQNFSKELESECFDVLEKLPPPSLNRNDPCLCGSGLKYKKCCSKKNRNSASIALRQEPFAIKFDGLTPEESKNDFQTVSLEDKELMSALYHNLQEHSETITSEDCEYFQKLNELHSKYPGNPMILNYIASGYNHLGMQDRTEELIAKTYEKFPNYLFAQTAQANIYLREGYPEKALEVLKGAYTLKQLYPHRTVFHISEVKTFEYFMVRYFCEIGNLEQANFHLQIMQKVLEEDDALLKHVQRVFKKSKVLYKFKAGMSWVLRSIRKKAG